MLAYQCKESTTCPTCKAPKGDLCKTPSGKETMLHTLRKRTWLKEQYGPEAEDVVYMNAQKYRVASFDGTTIHLKLRGRIVKEIERDTVSYDAIVDMWRAR